ncbi:EsaB/YukD family protein [Oceanobacillus sp. CFH 90083]|uniref:EsaB/YukD family protein n=1 Tax=Oceanobacillus sp. CFH 90083 TaxID=2592336 RepID=UPI00128AE172|nr:EsaB/YukD family protein [Oceanobacillus sp. CFH 90083]
MANNTHIDVTLDFQYKLAGGLSYDLRIPIQITVKQLIPMIMETLYIEQADTQAVIKIPTKNLLLSDDDYLEDFPVTNGDILVIL